MAILFDAEKRIFKLDSKDSSYVMMIGEGDFLLHLHYGAKLDSTDLSYLSTVLGASSVSPNSPDVDDYNFSLDNVLQEYSGNGVGDFRPAAIQIKAPYGGTTTDVRYKSHKIYKGKYSINGLPATYANSEDEADTLEILAEDPLTGVEITLIYGVFNNYSAITRSVRVKNAGDSAVDIERVFSTCVDFSNIDMDFISLWGQWAKERTFERSPLRHGVQSIESKRGASGHFNNPFIALCDHGATETAGDVYGFSFVYSGNFEAQAYADSFGCTRVLMGINPCDFNWHLEPGETFEAPEVVMVYSANGIGEMSRTYHKLYRYNLCRGPWKEKKRPILINNWEATYFKFDDKKLISIAKDAAELGIEMLVMDDGWFGKRNNDNCSLGDWFVNEDKISCGLSKLVEQINALGLKFGIWFEPEMVSPISRLYDEHPDWCLHVNGRKRSQARNQLVLDMSREDVRDYLFDSMYKVLSSANIEYVKWDFNRNLTEAASELLDATHQKEIFHRYMLGVYDLLERLLRAFPNLLLEGCAGGGGRFDPGMLYYSPQIWTSDDTDAMERLEIQYGTSIVYPPSSMSAHVSACPNHQTGRITKFKTRGHVAMAGAFGYELDINNLTDEERSLVREQIADYHKYYNVIHNGDYYRLISPIENRHYCAWEYVSPEKDEVLFTFVSVRSKIRTIMFVKLLGLDPDKRYRDEATGHVYTGRTLMSAGLNLCGNYGDGKSYVTHLKEVK